MGASSGAHVYRAAHKPLTERQQEALNLVHHLQDLARRRSRLLLQRGKGVDDLHLGREPRVGLRTCPALRYLERTSPRRPAPSGRRPTAGHVYAAPARELLEFRVGRPSSAPADSNSHAATDRHEGRPWKTVCVALAKVNLRLASTEKWFSGRWYG